MKISRLKTFALGGGSCTELSEFLCIGDYMSIGRPYNVTHEIDPNRKMSISGSDVFLCPELRRTKHPSNKLSQFFKDIIIYKNDDPHVLILSPPDPLDKPELRSLKGTSSKDLYFEVYTQWKGKILGDFCRERGNSQNHSRASNIIDTMN